MHGDSDAHLYMYIYMCIAGGGLQPVCQAAHSIQLVGAEVPFWLWSLAFMPNNHCDHHCEGYFLGELNGIEIGLSAFFKPRNKV